MSTPRRSRLSRTVIPLESVMSGEKELYPLIEKYLTENVGCVATKINTGTKFGHIDVLGLRERRSDYASQTELVAVEVKRGGTRFLNFVGQAFAYSLYAHRIYLAWEKPGGSHYTSEEIDIAAKFGVGLLSISEKGKIQLVASSSKFTPEHHHLLQAVHKLGYFECSLCRSYYPSESTVKINQRRKINLQDKPEYSGNFRKAIEQRRSALYYLFQLAEGRGDPREYTYDKRFICKDCCSIFSSLLPKEV
ncbi:MAG: hypothetical protein D6732_14930 [Methanobacteriota archaeon]|nr:MAG: hypothetical protein D6732_14930 [Euryarchaeota archaeon]